MHRYLACGRCLVWCGRLSRNQVCHQLGATGYNPRKPLCHHSGVANLENFSLSCHDCLLRSILCLKPTRGSNPIHRAVLQSFLHASSPPRLGSWGRSREAGERGTELRGHRPEQRYIIPAHSLSPSHPLSRLRTAAKMRSSPGLCALWRKWQGVRTAVCKS